MSNNINKTIVSLFKSFDDQKKYLKYAVVYSKMKFNDTYSLKMLKDIEINKDDMLAATTPQQVHLSLPHDLDMFRIN